jgi:hypothetical protein
MKLYIIVHTYIILYYLPLTKSSYFVCLSVAKYNVLDILLCNFKISVTVLGFNSHRGYGGA